MRIFSEFASEGEAAPSHRVEQRARLRANLADTGAIILVASAKGGVGKSVIAVNVAGALALRGKKVAIVDADLNAPSVSMMLGMRQPRGLPMVEGIEPATGPLGLRVLSSDLLSASEPPPISFIDAADDNYGSPAPARLTTIRQSEALLKMLAHARLGALDFMIIDLAPGIEDLHAVATMVAPHGIVMVSHSSTQAVSALQRAVRVTSKSGSTVLGLIENMTGFSCDGCRSVRPLMPEGNLAGMASDLELPVIGRLPFDPRLAEAADRGTLFVHEFADAPLAKSLVEIAATIERSIASGRRASAATA